jgi:hypothetical protein
VKKKKLFLYWRGRSIFKRRDQLKIDLACIVLGIFIDRGSTVAHLHTPSSTSTSSFIGAGSMAIAWSFFLGGFVLF